MKFGDKIGAVNSDYKCLIHLDRLSITFKLWSGSNFNDVRNPEQIQFEQTYKNITLIYDNSPGLGAYYHSYKVFYKGISVGRMHAATKLKKHEIQFDFAKEVFYSFYPEFWYEVYSALKTELKLLYNNTMYMEISIDTNKNLIVQYGYYFSNTIDNKLRSGDRYKLKWQTKVHVMENGESFIIAGSDNEIALYNKSKHAEQYIKEYYIRNGLANTEVFRIESRLKWDYIRYLRNKKGLDINVETLTDSKKLAKIFIESTLNKITFKDTDKKTIDKNRNSHFQEVSVIDDLPIETAKIGNMNPELRNNHYKTVAIDESIMRQNYYLFLESGNKKYFHNFKSSSTLAGIKGTQLENFIVRLNQRYKGNRTHDIHQRMQFAMRKIPGSPGKLTKSFNNLATKIKSILLGFL